VQGRRVPDGSPPYEYEPGDYGRARIRGGPLLDDLASHAEGPSNGWWFRTPNGMLGQMTSAHQVEEHEDGAISVEPLPWNSNSLLVTTGTEPDAKTWHGYIRHGVWEEC
jgi:hypothetical protein